MNDLKPCPFCGGGAQIEHDYDGFGYSYVRCTKCGLMSIKFIKSFKISSDKEAIDFWNRRVKNG